MRSSESKNEQVFNVKDLVDYTPKAVVIKSIMRKTTGAITVTAFDSGEVQMGKVSPFDTFIQIIEGKAQVVIDDESNLVELGQCIIIPAHSSNAIKANVKFKMLSVVIKSGYEDVS